MQLRDYQQRAIDALTRSYSLGYRAPLLVLPTGGGKTFTFAYIAKGARAKGNRVLIVVHRQELLTQASNALTALGVEHGRIAPGYKGEREPVAVASVQTLDRRLKKGPLDFDLIILDEAHHAVAGTWKRVIAQFPKARLLGVTATPSRLDGSGLGVEGGGLFDDLIIGPTVAELTDRGFLVPAEVYAFPTDLDLTGLKRTGGDFKASEVANRVNKATITGCAVEHYSRLAHNEPAIAFCASLEHAQGVTDQFVAAGYRWATIHGGLPDVERKRMLEGLTDGTFHGLSSVDLISEGTDVPVLSVGIGLRPTESESLYLQQIGRILRPAKGKTRGLWLDHVGNCFKHGLPEDERQWTLKGVSKKKNSGDFGPIVKQCKKCFAVWEKDLRCPYCGNVNVTQARAPEVQDGELRKIEKAELAAFKKNKMREYYAAQTFDEVKAIARKFGDKRAFAYKYWQTRTVSREKKKGAS